MAEPPLVIMDAHDVREHSHHNSDDQQDQMQSEQNVVVTTGGSVVDVNGTEDAGAPLPDGAADEERGEGRGRGAVEHEAHDEGHVMRDRATDSSFNPQGNNAQAFDAWLEPEAQNVVVTGDATLQGYRATYDEAGALHVDVLPNEVLNADSILSNIRSDETVRYIHPKHPIAVLRKNYGGSDMFACFDAMDVASSEKQGTVCSLFFNRNETPTIDITPEAPAGRRATIQVAPADVMDDNLTCTAVLKDSQGQDISSHITHSDCATVEVDLNGLVADTTVIADVSKSVSKANDGGIVGPLTLNIVTTDLGGLSASKSATLDLNGQVVASRLIIMGGEQIGTIGSEGEGPKYGVQGGGLCGSIAEVGKTATPGSNIAYLFFVWLVLTSLGLIRFKIAKTKI